jgi:outer membrane protein assembly factor BamB
VRGSTTLLAWALLLAGLLAPLESPAQRRGPYPGSSAERQGDATPTLVFSEVAELALPGAPTGPPLAAGGIWIVATEAGVYAFSAEGEPLWSREDLRPAYLSPTLTVGEKNARRLLWASSGAGGGSLLALHAGSGETVSELALPAPPGSPPALPPPFGPQSDPPPGSEPPREILLLLEDGTARSYDPASGEELWSTTVSDAVAHPPLSLAPGIALVTRTPGSLELVGKGLASSRPLLAISDHPTAPVLDPAATKKTRRSLFLSGRDGRLRSVRCKLKKSGTRCHQRWSFRTGARVEAEPVVLPQRVLVASWDNGLYSLGRRNGHLHWKTLASHRVGLTPVVAGPLIFLAPRTAEALQVFLLADGAAAGAYETGARQGIPREPALRGRRLALLVSGPARPGAEEQEAGRHRLRLLELSEAPEKGPGDTGGTAEPSVSEEGREDPGT